jgi:ParB-like chromosome segregation protein Spo0J
VNRSFDEAPRSVGHRARTGPPPEARRPEPQTVTVPVALLVAGESPRLEGQDHEHVARLTEVEGSLPPILVDRRTMQVIDGTHRLMAAALKGRSTIEVEFYDGDPADVFLRAVEANVTHGLPLSQSDRRAATKRIISSHPHLSDRAIAEVAGLTAKTVAKIRRDTDTTGVVPVARVGRDGRVRPLSSAEGRRRVAELIAERPQASLREVARSAGVSPTTASDVRKRLARGESPVPAPRAEVRPQPRLAVVPSSASLLEKLLRDPSLRHTETGRRLLRLLQVSALGAKQLPELGAAMPSHCTALVRQLAQQYALAWTEFANNLDEQIHATADMALAE